MPCTQKPKTTTEQKTKKIHLHHSDQYCNHHYTHYNNDNKSSRSGSSSNTENKQTKNSGINLGTYTRNILVKNDFFLG
jgi:hypothetical protein